ncbi:SipW-dependent-type signal peptide-containing protein [Haloplanus aerogenes]|uniref:Putative ribosomally synthesized peptide with SipW-like signal peptide n=1 Tax=Haloplanus aerogenes TaxID=660522 RepID=A0A3M0DTY5_9EURY|nr:SipW-dependent-type signal peptide-containing protein [Haloplanus aerogenes]RMB25588.1 putative ribosomally synthesized peptide with SipW-like signal peptide [Haloplanus aerogenes]
MTDETFNLSRRKALAALGSIGVASAGAGLGTSAYFSDQETFENNQLTAGTLDMKVAATEYYSDWSSDEAAYAGMAADAASTDIRLPAGDEQSDAQDIAIDIDGDNYANFFDAISTDADGNPYNRVNGGVAAAAEGLCGTESDADGPVIIDIGDVKPGDFGGAQFAFELCDNPGYVWLTGGLESASENGVTEPEGDDPDEEAGTVELLDEIQVAYGVGPINGDTSAFEDTDSGFQPTNQQSLREFLEMVNSGTGIALEGDTPAEQGGGTGRNCFAGSPETGSAVHQVSVVWWLPIDHGNQVQSDSVTFDLGFYTEQCRHNDGSGNRAMTITTERAFSGSDSQNCNFGSPISLPYGGLGSEQVLSIDLFSDPVEIEIDLAKELVGGQYPDNFGLAFNTNDDDAADDAGDFQVLYTAGSGFSYESPVATGSSPGLPSGIDGTAEGNGRYTIEIDRSLLGTSFAVGGKAGYASETPPSGSGNVVVNFTPEFCFGPDGFDDASTYVDVNLE